MMYIEGHWETIDTLQDIVRVIREYYNRELADEMEEQVEQLIDAFNERIEQLEDQVYNLEDEIYAYEGDD